MNKGIELNTAKFHHLKELAEIRAGYTFRGSPTELPGSGIRMLQIKDIRDTDTVNPDSLQAIAWTGKDSMPNLDENEIVVAARGLNNKAAIMRSSATVIPSNQLLVLRVKHNTVLPDYLCWFLNRTQTQKQLKDSQVGTNIPSLNKSGLGDIQVPIFSIETQQKLVALAMLQQQEQAAYQALINNRISMLEGVFQQLIVGESK